MYWEERWYPPAATNQRNVVELLRTKILVKGDTMITVSYYELYRNSKNMYDYRRRMVRYAIKYGNKPAAREFSTTPKTVRKWVKRYSKENNYRLQELSRRPHSNPKEIEPFWQFKICDICNTFQKRKKRLTAARLHRDHPEIPYSVKTIAKVMKKNGFMKLAKRKYERKRDLRELKKKYKPFEKIQVDVKYLDDIPEMFKEFVQHKLPKYLYSARCMRTGAYFISYGEGLGMSQSITFILLLLKHLKKHGIRLRECRIQTDNGSEFIGNTRKKEDSRFTKIIEKNWKMVHRLIPPGAKTWQSDVETAHRLIEDELYAYETFNSKSEFFKKSAQYIDWFNTGRNNSYKGGSPKQIIQEIDAAIDMKVLHFSPVLLENYFEEYYNYITA
jgi:hypothetical protein